MLHREGRCPTCTVGRFAALAGGHFSLCCWAFCCIVKGAVPLALLGALPHCGGHLVVGVKYHLINY
ncbi:hypothetical protein PU02_0291 [Bartonella ancashensis]|uniref:Uncharacterized protein n=1 Tax=Bartonella ancashensis TaxID=1318743 RepID=A0A0M3T2P7_9HYPH|nr:hypothetical protein PU02_0291 [Bartonella ancashensis]